MASLEVFSATGNTLYVVLRNVSNQVWNVGAAAWQTYNVANWAQYAIPLTEDTSSGWYTAAVPAGISTTTVLRILVYGQLGGSPAAGDDNLGVSISTWTGSTWSTSVDVASISGSTTAAIRLALSAATIVSGAAVTGTLTVAQMTTNLSAAVDKLYYGRVVYFTSGALAGQVAAISGYNGTTKTITFFQVITSAPANGDSFIIV